MKLQRIFFLITGLLASSIASAQESDLDSIKTKELETIVISSIRADEKMPVTQTTLPKSEIKLNYTGQEMPVMLSRTPSVTWYSDGGHFTGYSYVRLRGIDQTRINFTLNGVPLNEPEDQGAYFSNYADFFNNVESMQVQRGVGTTSNGTTSYGGSVNFESPSLLKPAGVEVQTSFGSFNTWQVSPQVRTGLLKNKTAFYARYSNTGSDGFREHSGTRGQTFFLSGGYFGKKSVLKFTGFTGTSKSSMAYLAVAESDLENSYRMNYLRDDENDQFKQTLASLQYSLSVSKNSFITTTTYYNQLSGNYDVYFDPDMLNFAVRSNFYGAIINHHTEKENFKLDAGFHINQYEREHFLRIKPDVQSNLYLNSGNKREVSGFVKALKTYNSISFFADAQVRSVSFSYTPDKAVNLDFDDIQWLFLNPKAGLTYQVGKHSVYVSAGMTSREPTRNDMFAGYDNIDDTNYDEVGDFTKVKPERVADLELGTQLNFKSIKIEANLFNMQFKNEIAAIGQLSFIGLPLRKNVASSYRRGIELSAEARISKSIQSNTQATFSRNRIQKYTSDVDNVTYRDVQPLLTPSAIVNQMFRFKVARSLNLQTDFRYLSSAFLDNTNNGLHKTPESLITNASVHIQIFKKYDFSLMANNIFNSKYYTAGYVQGGESYYFAMARRNYYVSLTIRI
jgi:iron complex outermembrane recepter protein